MVYGVRSFWSTFFLGYLPLKLPKSCSYSSRTLGFSVKSLTLIKPSGPILFWGKKNRQNIYLGLVRVTVNLRKENINSLQMNSHAAPPLSAVFPDCLTPSWSGGLADTQTPGPAPRVCAWAGSQCSLRSGSRGCSSCCWSVLAALWGVTVLHLPFPLQGSSRLFCTGSFRPQSSLIQWPPPSRWAGTYTSCSM